MRQAAMAVKAGGATAAWRSTASGEGGEGTATRAAAERRLREAANAERRRRSGGQQQSTQRQEYGVVVESGGGTGGTGEVKGGEGEEGHHA